MTLEWKKGSEMPAVNVKVLAYVNGGHDMAINVNGEWRYFEGYSMPTHENDTYTNYVAGPIPEHWTYLPKP